MSWESGLNKKDKANYTSIHSFVLPNCEYKMTSCFTILMLLPPFLAHHEELYTQTVRQNMHFLLEFSFVGFFFFFFFVSKRGVIQAYLEEIHDLLKMNGGELN